MLFGYAKQEEFYQMMTQSMHVSWDPLSPDGPTPEEAALAMHK